MYPKSRDLEIVYNLVWRSKPHQSDDRANIVGMYDIPSTTLDWKTFKSYLLKNSGSNATDIKVSYIDFDDKEIAINHQNDFQLALYSFRRRARVGEIITLKLDKVNSTKSITQLLQKMDAEIQTTEFNEDATQFVNAVHDNDDTPPKWFTKHMKKFEKKMLEEMKQQFALMSCRVQNACQHSHPSRPKSSKSESYKRSRKLEFTKINLDKDMCKKYAFKLDEPEHRPSQKTKVKKLTPIKISSDSDVGRECKYEAAPEKPINLLFSDPTPALNNVVLNSSSHKTAGNLFVNSVYLQKWEVTNSGINAWDERTELRYAWGSEELRPTFTILRCPELQPGEKGEISVWFQIPSTPGFYECFWHFYDCGRRFGRWVCCQVVVVDYPRKQHSPYATTPLEISRPPTYIPVSPVTTQAATKLDPIDLSVTLSNGSNPAHVSSSNDSLTTSSEQPQQSLERTEVETGLSQSRRDRRMVKIANCQNLDYTSNCEPDSDSDNASIVSGAQTPHSGSSDYVLIPSSDVIPADELANVGVVGQVVELAVEKAESIEAKVPGSPEVITANQVQQDVQQIEIAIAGEAIGDAKQVIEESGINDAISVASEAKSELEPDADAEAEFRDVEIADVDIESTEYAYIYYNGEKYPFHKDYLRSEYFNEAEKCIPLSHGFGSANLSISSKTSNESYSTQVRSRDPSISSQDGKRLFVFPRHSPGFEVVYPDNVAAVPKTESSTCSYEGEEYYSIKDGFQFPPTSESNFYQDRQLCGLFGLGGHASTEHVPSQASSTMQKMYQSLTPQEVSQLVEAQDVQGISSTTDMSQLAMAHTTPAPSMTYTSSPINMAENDDLQSQPQPASVLPSTSAVSTASEVPMYHGRVYRPSLGHPSKRDNVITEAAMLAGSAMGTMRNVVNRVLNTGNGRWVKGHWVAEGTNSKHESELRVLAEMGFMDRDLNATLLARYNDDVDRVISELVQ